MAPNQTDGLLKRVQVFVGLCTLLSFVAGPALGVLTFKVSSDYRIKSLEESMQEHNAAVRALNEERVAIARTLARLESQVSSIGLMVDRVANILDRGQHSKGGPN